MAIKTVKATIDGQTYNLTRNSSTGKWEATVTAPGKTSYNLSGGYYNVSVTATNDAGTTGSADASTLNGLKLVVKETVAPIITIVSPSSGAYVTNSKQPVVFTVVDEAGGSGVDIATLSVKLDNAEVAAATITKTAITNGYQVTYTPANALSDGAHTVKVNCKDHDGNAATEKSTTYTNDTTSSPVTITIKLNGTDQGSVPVATGGTFSKQITLANGSNTIVVTATDAAGKTSSVTRKVTLDTSVPKITAAVITPNPADTGATMVISVTIE